MHMSPPKKVMVSKRKGRIGGAALGGLLLGPLGLGLGALIGTRTEHYEADQKPTVWEDLREKERARLAAGGKPVSSLGTALFVIAVMIGIPALIVYLIAG